MIAAAEATYLSVHIWRRTAYWISEHLPHNVFTKNHNFLRTILNPEKHGKCQLRPEGPVCSNWVIRSVPRGLIPSPTKNAIKTSRIRPSANNPLSGRCWATGKNKSAEEPPAMSKKCSDKVHQPDDWWDHHPGQQPGFKVWESKVQIQGRSFLILYV